MEIMSQLARNNSILGIRQYVNKCKAETGQLTSHVEALDFLLTELDKTSSQLSEAKSENERLREAVKAIRKSDCGGWLKDCGSVMFTCADGREKRQELMKLLDNLYKQALREV